MPPGCEIEINGYGIQCASHGIIQLNSQAKCGVNVKTVLPQKTCNMVTDLIETQMLM